MARRGKKYKEAVSKVDSEKVYGLSEAVKTIRSVAFAKFDETVDIAIALNLKKSHTVRDTVVLPHQFGGEKRVAVFAKGDKAAEAKEMGATIVGDIDLVEKVQGGWLEFDVCIATPDMMKDVGKLGPILGRKGLMPNPRTGTVTMNLKAAIAELKQGRVEFRANKENVIHLGVGKLSMKDDEIEKNIGTLLGAILKKKPVDLKGDYIRSVAIATTMGPGLKIEQEG